MYRTRARVCTRVTVITRFRVGCVGRVGIPAGERAETCRASRQFHIGYQEGRLQLDAENDDEQTTETKNAKANAIDKD
jgi:hypothetical protein